MNDKYPYNVDYIARLLEERYKNFNHYNKHNPFDELLFIICSIKTDEAKYLETYKSLKRLFPKFESLSDATETDIASAIAPGGLSKQKSVAIKRIVREIKDTFGRCTLAPLKKMTNEDCEDMLISLPYVGKKVARCVMMYSLDRLVFPVDTHVWRISQRLGWITPSRKNGSCSQKDMDILQEKIPPLLRYSLHVNMISLGRKICLPKNPKCDSCALEICCPKVGMH